MPVAHDTVAVGALTVHVLSLRDRRGAKPHREKRFVFQSQLEACIFGARDNSTGAVQKLLQRVSLTCTTLCIGRATVEDGLVLNEEFDAVLHLYKSTIADVEQRARVRNVTVVPITVASAAAQAFGRCPRTTALLRAFSALPKVWEMEEERDMLAEQVRSAAQRVRATPPPRASVAVPPPLVGHRSNSARVAGRGRPCA
jgi:hypothetical protein